QRELPMRAAVLEREDLAGIGPDEHDRLAGEGHRERLVPFQLSGLGDGMPVAGIARDAAQVRPATAGVRRAPVGHFGAYCHTGVKTISSGGGVTLTNKNQKPCDSRGREKS